MSITPVPISIRLVLTPIAASRGKGGELAGEMVDADERPVDPDLLGGDRELHRLAQRIAAIVGQAAARVPRAEREEADLLWTRHGSGIPTWLTAQVFRSGRTGRRPTKRP